MMHEESEIIIESCHSRTLPIANVKGSNQQPETLFYLTIRAPIHSAFRVTAGSVELAVCPLCSDLGSAPFSSVYYIQY